MKTLTQFWIWWVGQGTPAAAIQQLFFIVLTTVATIVAVFNLTTWRRQQRANLRSAAISEIIQSVVLVCDHVLVERIRPEPMVWFNKIDKPNFDWYAQARSLIATELKCWNQRLDELDARIRSLNIAIAKAHAILGTDFDGDSKHLMTYLDDYKAAVKRRMGVITHCSESASEMEYKKLVGLVQLLHANPLLCLHKNSKESLEIDEGIKRARIDFRTALSKLY